MNDKYKLWLQKFLKQNKDEFKSGVTDDFDLESLPEVSRRKFMALLGASTAFAAACTNYRDKGEIIPYNKKPEEIIPGIPNYYASTCTACSLSCGTLVKTREGRPIKLEGNKEHPTNHGKICAIGESSILNLYDPERIPEPMNRKGNELILFNSDIYKEKWENIDKDVVEALIAASKANKEIAIITRTITSPAFASILNDFKTKYPTTKLYSLELFDDEYRKTAWEACYGTRIIPSIKWNEAKIILTLESDILATEGHFVEQIYLFSKTRDFNNIKDFSRLYASEATLTLTGSNADYRIKIRPEAQYDFAMSLANELSGGKYAPNHSLQKFAVEAGINHNNLISLVKDLKESKGKSIVFCGSKLPVETHIAVNLLNEILENNKLFNYDSVNIEYIKNNNLNEFETLIKNLNAGQVGVVLHIDTNPAYILPEELGYEKAVAKAALTITLSEGTNETTKISKLILPINHNLESWGIHKTRSDVYSFQQPVIMPLYNTRQAESILLNWLSDKPEKYDENNYLSYLKNFVEKEIYSNSGKTTDFTTFWNLFLHDGVYINPKQENGKKKSSNSGSAQFKYEALSKLEPKPMRKDYTLILNQNYFLGDGKYANNGWLQELPHPITKITWDNYASISPKTAKELKLNMCEMANLQFGNQKLKLPVMVQMGMSDNVIAVELGYGRRDANEVANDVGLNANGFLDKEEKFSKWIILGATFEKTSGKYKLAATQEHHLLEEEFVKDLHKKRKIIKESVLSEYEKNDDPFERKLERSLKIININPKIKYPGVKWGMAIDLNKCVGCGMCVSACNVENNVPVVGKDQVLNGREMQWLRIDRYYSGTDEEPTVSNQPLLCAHCDDAPCENVCPVSATNHSPDGLNQMAYNRCVGTRYCSNNCPFKVRRFNFFNYRDRFEDGYYQRDSLQLLHNPEVTVRSRGVMEKCTFCVQRIMEARQNATKENRELVGTDVKTACQISCPAEAITFGDMNDKQSELVKLMGHNLGYTLLDEIDIKPNITFIAKLRNTHPEEV